MTDEVSPIKLGKTQEIESIRVDIADNDGIIVSWSVYTPSKSKSGSAWDEHKEVFDKQDDALARVKELFTAEINRKLEKNKK